MKNLAELILEQMDLEHSNKEYTSRQISDWCDNNKDNPVIQKLSENPDYPFFQDNYIASTFKNYCLRPKEPKIKRRHINKRWHYSLIPKSLN